MEVSSLVRLFSRIYPRLGAMQCSGITKQEPPGLTTSWLQQNASEVLCRKDIYTR